MRDDGSLLLIHLSSGLAIAGLLSFAVCSVWLSVVDVSTHRLPSRLVRGATAVTLGLLAASSVVLLPTALRSSALEDLAALVCGALGLFLLFLLLWRLAPGQLGGGDVKVAPLVGGVAALLGGPWVLLGAIAVAAVAAAIWGTILTRRHAPTANTTGSRRAALPFAPCLFAGTWLALIASLAMSILV